MTKKKKILDAQNELFYTTDFNDTMLIEKFNLKYEEFDDKDKDSFRHMCLKTAAALDKKNIVKHLIKEHPGDVNVLIHSAINDIYIEDKMTEFIINEYSADVNILLKGRTPLHSAIHNSDSDRSNFNKIKMLLDNGANVNAQIEHYDFDDEDDEDYEDDGKTALHLAIDDNWIEVIKMLLENDKLNLNVKDSYGETPIDLAFKYHNIEVIKLLLVASLNQINTKISEKKDEDALKYAIEKLEQIKTSITIE